MRLIDADAIHFCEFDLDNYHWFRAVDEDEIAEMPTIDAVPVVRCKDCKWHRLMEEKEEFIQWHNCTLFCADIDEDDFCSYGERKKNEVD